MRGWRSRVTFIYRCLVRASWLDMNGHMNVRPYFDVFSDACDLACRDLGLMEPDLLCESPLIGVALRGPEQVFDEDRVARPVQRIEQINTAAVPDRADRDAAYVGSQRPRAPSPTGG